MNIHDDVRELFKRTTSADKKEFINFLLICCAAVSAVITFLYAYIGLFLTLFLGVITLFFNAESIKKEFLLFIVCLMFLAVSCILNAAFGSAVILVNSMLYCMLFNSIGLKRQHIMIISAIIPVCLTLILLFAKKPEGYEVYYYIFTGERINPNMIGMIIFFIMTNAICIIKNIRQLNVKWKVLLSTAVFIACAYFILKTKARTSLLAGLVFVLFIFFRNTKWFKDNKKYKFFLSVAWCFVIIVTLVYIFLYNKLGEDGIKILGKSLFSGREKVWIDAYRMIKEHMFFGSGNKELFIGVFESAHNSLLAIWKTFGVFAMIIFVIIYVSSRDKAGCEVDTIYRAMIVAVLFIATFETVFNDTHSYFLCILPLLNKTVVNNGEADGKTDSLLLVR